MLIFFQQIQSHTTELSKFTRPMYSDIDNSKMGRVHDFILRVRKFESRSCPSFFEGFPSLMMPKMFSTITYPKKHYFFYESKCSVDLGKASRLSQLTPVFSYNRFIVKYYQYNMWNELHV